MSIHRTSDRVGMSTAQLLPTGMIVPYMPSTVILNAVPVPAGWLLCSGAAVSRTTYGGLFGALAPFMGNPTISIASPAVVTLNNHGLVAGDSVYFTTTGTLPTGISANTIYSVWSPTTNTFEIAPTNNPDSPISTSGSQSGIHSLNFCPYGLGNGSTTFNVPDLRGNVPAGLDNIGGTAANRINTAVNSGQTIGGSGGEQTHLLTGPESGIQAHAHTIPYTTGQAVAAGPYGEWINTGSPNTNFTSNSTGPTNASTAHNNLQPYILTNWLIRY